MKAASIEELALLMKQAKEEGSHKPIFFIGAGASKTGGIPLANEIVSDILEKFGDNPKVMALKDDASKTYYSLLECLTPFARKKLLKEYVDRAKINVPHIYLAQLLNEGYVDFVLTVNFDNLLLRALALFNNFPAVYDMAILKDTVLSDFKEKSVIYLHGQYHEPWLMHSDKEIERARQVLPPLFYSINNQRPWVFLGYSGEDPVFDEIIKLGHFNQGLYWVTHNNYNTNVKVYKELIENNNLNAHIINGYDADSFMLKLNSELKLPQPLVLDKPFSLLKNTLSNLVDVENSEYFKGVKERLEMSKKDVEQALLQYEDGKFEFTDKTKHEIENNLLKKKIIDLMIKGEFNQEEIYSIEETAKILNNDEIKKLLAALFNHWGIVISNLAKLKNDEELFIQGIEKFKKGTELNPKNDSAFYNWGNSIFDLAKLRNDSDLFEQSVEKYKIATELNPERRKRYLQYPH